MAIITTRAGKGSPLTNAEVDANFTNLNAGLTTDAAITGGSISGVSINSSGIGGTTPSTAVFTTLSTTGNVILGDAAGDTVRVNGYMGIGGGANSVVSHYMQGTHQGSATDIYASRVTQTIPSTATSVWAAYTNISSTTAAESFTITNTYGFRAENVAKGAGSTITNQHGLYVGDLTSGDNNYGVRAQVSSGTNKWNIYANGTAQNYFQGNVGIGSGASAPDSPLVVAANTSAAAVRITQTGAGNALLVEDSANPDSTPFVIDATGRVIIGSLTPYTLASSVPAFQSNTTGITPVDGVSWFNGVNAQFGFGKSRSGTVGTNGVVSSGDGILLDFRFDDGASFIRGASIAAVVDGTPGTNDMPGRLVFSTTADGASTPTERFRISNTGDGSFAGTGALKLHSGTTAQRPASPSAGALRFNTTNNGFEGYDGTAWGAVGGGATGGSGNPVFYENDQTVTASYTLTTNKNAGTFGPITIDSGVTVTVPSGSTWTVV